MRTECFRVLVRALSADEDSTRGAASQVISTYREPELGAKGILLRMLKDPPSIDALSAALAALGHGWSADSDVGAAAETARHSVSTSVLITAIQVRAKRGETDTTDFNRFFAVTFNERHRSISEEIQYRDLIEHFASAMRDEFIARLHAVIKKTRDHNLHQLKTFIAALIICDPTDSLIEESVIRLLGEDWMIRYLFIPSSFPIEKLRWTPKLTDAARTLVENSTKRFNDYEFYWLAKVIHADFLKKYHMGNLRAEGLLSFWSAKALAESWGSDTDVRDLFLACVEGDTKEIVTIAEVLPDVIKEKDLCREVILRAFRQQPKEVGSLFEGLLKMGTFADDNEMFAAAQSSLESLDAPLYRDQWRRGMISVFPSRPEVRSLAREEMKVRSGAVASIAQAYPDDVEILSELAAVVVPVPEDQRENLVGGLKLLASTNDHALEILEASREDTADSVFSEATVGYVEALLARGLVEQRVIDDLVENLEALGPLYDSVRAASVVSLLVAGRLDLFASSMDGKEPLKVSVSRALFRENDKLLRRIVTYWPSVTQVLNGEEIAIERLGLDPSGVLPMLDASWPNGHRVFDLLLSTAESNVHVSKHIILMALARFVPGSERLREAIWTALTTRDYHYWGKLIAGEIFADQFSDDIDFRIKVVALFKREPNGPAAAALAELLLRYEDSDLRKNLREGTRGRNYDVATHFKLVAAISAPKTVLDYLEKSVDKVAEQDPNWHFPRWVPAIARRIASDSDVAEAIRSRLEDAIAPSIKVSLLSLLQSAVGVDERLRMLAAREIELATSKNVPDVGFDITIQADRIVPRVLMEVLG